MKCLVEYRSVYRSRTLGGERNGDRVRFKSLVFLWLFFYLLSPMFFSVKYYVKKIFLLWLCCLKRTRMRWPSLENFCRYNGYFKNTNLIFCSFTYLGLKLGKVWAEIDFPALDTFQSFFDFYWPSLLDSVAPHSTNNDSMDTFLCAFFRIFIFVQNNIIFIRKVCKRARFEQKENDYLQDSCNWWNCISLEKSLVNSYKLVQLVNFISL